MQVWLIVAASVVAVAVLGWLFLWPGAADTTMEVLVPNSQSGKSQYVPSARIFRSFNQPDGAVFTYATWMVVNDFTFNYGRRRFVFGKNDCPGVYIDSTSNSLLVMVNTFGAAESILIPNIPAQKWIHLVVEVNQYSLSVYINGLLRQTHTLAQLPKQNMDSILVGSAENSWDGSISGLTYYSRTLKPEEIEKLATQQPSMTGIMPVMPPYSDITWYIGRFNSS